jgi:hypothetical protein
VDVVPEVFHLHHNYPNPFNPSTTIAFTLPRDEFVTLKVFNVLGQEVRTLVNEKRNAGLHRVVFDAAGLTSGVYVYKLLHTRGVMNGKMMLVR